MQNLKTKNNKNKRGMEMRKIICVALNPAMDKTILIENFELGCLHRIEETDFHIGGKGINVAKTLMNFDIKSIVTGFVGGVWADTFRTQLMKQGIETKFFKLLQDTRSNIKLIDKKSCTCTAINEVGPFVPEEMVERFIQSFTIMCHPEDIIILTGGTPPGVPTDIYHTLGIIAKKKGAYLIVDAKGAVFEKSLLANPDIVKLNYRNYVPKEHWRNITPEIKQKLISYAKKLHVPTVLISLGSAGAILVKGGEVYCAKALELEDDLKHPVGAGDAMVAALVMGTLEEFETERLLRYAVACGAASVVCKGTTGCTTMKVNELILQVQIEKVE
jgi:1-phosphofructokinase